MPACALTVAACTAPTSVSSVSRFARCRAAPISTSTVLCPRGITPLLPQRDTAASRRASIRVSASGKDTKPPTFEGEIPREAAEGLLNVMETNKQFKLLASLCIDAIGAASYLLPVVGEASDFAWAPIQFLLLQNLYGSGLFAALGFAEEAFPGLDFIPTATIGWMLENVESLSGIRKILLGKAKDKSK